MIIMKIALVNGLLMVMVAFAVAISLSNADDSDDAMRENKIPTVKATTTTEPTTTSTTTKPATITSTIPTSTTASSTASASIKFPEPLPPPPPAKGTWNVTSGYTCILFDAGIRMTFNYQTTSGKMTSHSMDVPQNATASGSCDPEKQYIQLNFNGGWELAFTFEPDQNSTKYKVTSVTLFYNENIFPDAKDHSNHTAVNDKPLFPTDVHKKFVCNSQQYVLRKNISPGVTDISTFSLQFEAFGNFTSHTFSSGTNYCSADEWTAKYYIIVAFGTLGGLIIVLLTAYLIGRRRSRRGYESV